MLATSLLLVRSATLLEKIQFFIEFETTALFAEFQFSVIITFFLSFLLNIL
jgi:hypothetical protein